MWTGDTFILAFGTLFIAFLLGSNADSVPVLADAVAGAQGFFQTAKDDLQVSALEDVWAFVLRLVAVAHDGLNEAAQGALQNAGER